MQQILISLKSLSEVGNEIEILETQSFHHKPDPDGLLQNKEIMTKIHKSISQMKRGKIYNQEEAFDMAFIKTGPMKIKYSSQAIECITEIGNYLKQSKFSSSFQLVPTLLRGNAY